MQREGVEDDFVMLGRATWAGSQRWGGALWSGDIHSHWAVLSQQFTAGLNAAMSGARCLFHCGFLNVVLLFVVRDLLMKRDHLPSQALDKHKATVTQTCQCVLWAAYR
jgi:hypothetical protein